MQLVLASVSAALFGVVAAYIPASTAETDHLAAIGLGKLITWTNNRASNSTCTIKTAHVRREWGSLPKSQRKAYTDAVLCLMSKPPLSDPAIVPGAQTRYDDFVALHINQTMSVHGTANFLSWHRYYIWAYETALRDECGYTGFQPYWNWGKYAFDPLHSPIFDGSEYSMSGNGIYEPHECTQALPTALNCIPPGEGGGCVETGPFKNMTVNLGPVAPTLRIDGLSSIGFNFSHNPRCLRRDVSSWVSSNWTRDIDSASLIRESPTISYFQNLLQGGDFSTGSYGVHAGGHFTLGGDPAGDIFVSPGDPVFWLHHGNIDRTWWMWQNLDLSERLTAVGGTITFNNDPPSRNGTADDLLNLGVCGPERAISEMLSTMDGPLCYIYL